MLFEKLFLRHFAVSRMLTQDVEHPNSTICRYASQGCFGMIAPPGFQGYNGMVYTTSDPAFAAASAESAIPLEGKQAIFLAIRPANAARFSQVELPDLRVLSDSAK